MLTCTARQLFLVRAERQLHGLHQLEDEAVDRPRVDELSVAFRMSARLSVALSDLNHGNVEIPGKLCPLLASLRSSILVAQCPIEIEQSLLHEVRYETRIGAMIDDGGRCVWTELFRKLQGLFANQIIRALAYIEHRVVVDPGPRLDGGVHVQRAAVGTKPNQVEARYIHRKIQNEIARVDILGENASIVERFEVRVQE